MYLSVMFEGAKEKLVWRCGKFANVFAHEKTVGDSHVCLADILKLVKTVLVSTLSYIAQGVIIKRDFATMNFKPKEGLNGFNVNGSHINPVVVLRTMAMISIKSGSELIVKINALNVAQSAVISFTKGFSNNVIFILA